jgi:hypothetical protein
MIKRVLWEWRSLIFTAKKQKRGSKPGILGNKTESKHLYSKKNFPGLKYGVTF